MSLLSQKIAGAVSAIPKPGPCVVDDGRYQLGLDLRSAHAELGVSFDALNFRPLQPSDRPIESLKTWADRLVARFTYLMEPLAVLEVDSHGGEVEIRSQAPSLREDRLTYYELRLKREGSARLRRVVYDKITKVRSLLPCSLSCEALERLTDDLIAAYD